MLRKKIVLIFLAVVWLVTVGWQIQEHDRFMKSSREGFLIRARDITNSLATVIRAQRRFGGIVKKSRLESALGDLVKMDELLSIALLNSTGEVVASAGREMNLDINSLPEKGERWNPQEKSVTYVNLVDLGVDQDNPQGESSPTIILNLPDIKPGDRPPRPPDWFIDKISAASPAISATQVKRFMDRVSGPNKRGDAPPQPDWLRELISSASSPISATDVEQLFKHRNPRRGDSPPPSMDWRRDRISSASPPISATAPQQYFGRRDDFGRRGDDGRRGNDRFRSHGRERGPRSIRPFWMDEETYKSILEKQGFHGFVLELSTRSFNNARDKDIWVRLSIVGFALIAMLGLGFAWRNLIKSSALQLRLVRTSEMNAHLREMNIAAAGLAHETRNPLNIVRGLAQLIAKQTDADNDIHQQAVGITEEVDRVTVQLNDFIDYSKPCEAKPILISINSVASDVERALKSDLEDKNISFNITGPELVIEADETFLRQLIFNLLLNAIQATDDNGIIKLTVGIDSVNCAFFEIQDNGCGVPPEDCDKIFRPYYTSKEKGTGLGLAVVNQIVLAHGWEMECLQIEGNGACFRVRNITKSA